MNLYDERYFLRGKETGLSLYENYRWMPDLTLPMVDHIAAHLGVEKSHTVLDFGCARGYVVRAFRERGYEAYGIDASEWAIRNCDQVAAPYVNWTDNGPPLLADEFDWVVAKDVLEHVSEVSKVITNLMNAARCGMFVVVPLSSEDGEPYVVADYEKDVTHIHRLSLATWARMFMRVGWRVEAMHRLKGVKDNYAQWENGNGFITARRI